MTTVYIPLSLPMRMVEWMVRTYQHRGYEIISFKPHSHSVELVMDVDPDKI